MQRFKDLFMKDWFFFVIAACICAGVVGSAHMYLIEGTGYMNGLTGALLLKEGDFTTAAGFGGGFLIARILEGPLVGLIDIGGSMMHGVGCGVVGLLYSVGLGFLVDNFALSIITGAVIGLAIAAVVMGIRYLVPSGIQAGGSDIMMGVGHQLSSWLGPLFLISALSVSVPIGIAGTIGGTLFYLKGKNIVGGIIIGMFIAAFFWPVISA